MLRIPCGDKENYYVTYTCVVIGVLQAGEQEPLKTNEWDPLSISVLPSLYVFFIPSMLSFLYG
jgi:hypothetical protein